MEVRKADKIIRIPTSTSNQFFRYWFEFMKPFHKLTGREMDVIICLTKHRYELSKVILDNDILDKVTMSEDTKTKVREECGITLPHFQVILGKLRKNKVIIDDRINPKFIPNLGVDSNNFKLIIEFGVENV